MYCVIWPISASAAATVPTTDESAAAATVPTTDESAAAAEDSVITGETDSETDSASETSKFSAAKPSRWVWYFVHYITQYIR